jgi:hypothetical protein
MSKITYDYQHIKPISAISIVDSPTFNENGLRTENLYSISLRGYMLANLGSPSSSGTFGDFGPNDCQSIAETGIGPHNWTAALLTKRCALSNLLKNDYRELLIGTSAGTANLTCYPRVTSFSVEESDNPQFWPFTINFEADNLFCSGIPLNPTGVVRVRSFSETWDFGYSDDQVASALGDNRIYNVSHSMSAQGITSYGASGVVIQSGIDNARNYVAARIGLLANQPVLAISGFDNYTTKYNYVDTHNIDVGTSTYSVNESWVYSTGSYVEEYTIETNTQNSRTCPTVSINGTITGFGVRSLASGEVTTSKYDNALAYWNTLYPSGLYARAQTVSAQTLYADPFSTSVSTSPIGGIISYNYEYRGGPTKKLSGATFENIVVSNTFGQDIFAVPTILGMGESIQRVNGSGFGKLNNTSLSIDATYPCSTGIHLLGPRFTPSLTGDLQNLINSYDPYLTISGVGYSVVDSQSENWNAYDSSYSYSVSWLWQMSGVCA